MAFDSAGYLFFLGAVLLIFFAVDARRRWLVLLAASVAFYAAARAPYLLVVLSSTVAVTYLAGLGIAGRRRPALFWGAVLAELSLLAGLKYLPPRLGSGGPFVSVGVSYYIFQAISYLADVYLEKIEAERHVGYLALHLCFFPKLLQGPLERAEDLLPQLRSTSGFDYQNARAGLLLFGWGLFKKAVVAGRLGVFVDGVYGQVRDYSGLPLALAVYGYAFQLYCDFSGYTDMALGSALLFNIRLTQNFRSPYLATSVAEFWRRWHISFSRWLLDYIFTPLQMRLRRWETWGTVASLMATFLVCGAWHGASLNFILWGALHGVFLAAGTACRPWQKRVYARLGLERSRAAALWRRAATFHLVCLSWIFFRLRRIPDALYVCRHVFQATTAAVLLHGERTTVAGARPYWEAVGGELWPCALLIALILAVDRLQERGDVLRMILGWPVWARWPLYFTLFYAILLLGLAREDFLYLRF